MNDEKTIIAIRDRSEAVMGQVMNRYTKLVWAVASAVLCNAGSVQDVEECVADVFIFLWQNPEKYQPEKGKNSSWLCMVARSKAIDRYRRLVRRQEVLAEDGGWLFETEEYNAEEYREGIQEGQQSDRVHQWTEAMIVDVGATKDDCEQMRECVSRLKKQEQEIIVRRYYHEQKPKEIALALGIPKKQVENHLYQAKQKLKKMLQAEPGMNVPE